MLKRLLPLALLISHSVTALDLSGSYEVQGTEASGLKYQGTASIKEDGQFLKAIWTLDGEVYKGTGLKKDNFVAFMFKGEGSDSKTGVQIYKIEKDKLTGQWLLFDQSNSGNEVLQRK